MPDPVATDQEAAHAPDAAIALLRHTIATLAYRAAKVLRDAPESFATFEFGPTTRTPHVILAHMGDLAEWALTIAEDRVAWPGIPPTTWADDVKRFFDALDVLDARLAAALPIAAGVPEKLFQGPIADALTHTGQLAMLRRAAGHPVRGESYFRADIATGRTGIEQAAPKVEFD